LNLHINHGCSLFGENGNNHRYHAIPVHGVECAVVP
jgi:hypothetical protein